MNIAQLIPLSFITGIIVMTIYQFAKGKIHV